MLTIATIEIDRTSVFNAAFSKKRLAETRNKQNGALNRLLTWIKSETGRTEQDISSIRLGGDEDNFLFLYYVNGTRYKIFKDGTCMVSTGDSLENLISQNASFNRLVNMIVADEINARMKAALKKNDIALAKTVPNNVDDEGMYCQLLSGVVG